MRYRIEGDRELRVVYSIATNIGGGGMGVDGFEAVKALYQKGYLKKIVAYGNRQNEIPGRYIRSIRVHPVKVFSSLPARYYYPAKRKALDHAARRVLKTGAAIFHGWSSSSLESLRFCREEGIISFLENPGPHYLYAEEILGREFRRLGVARSHQPALLRGFFGQDETYHLSEYEEASYIIAESEFTKDTFIAGGIPREKLLVLPRGVDTVRYTPPARKPESVFRVLFVGAICIRKGVHYLLEAWSRLRLKNSELILAGTVRDEVKPFLRRHAEEGGAVRILGFVEDPVRLYQESSAFVFPSLSEGSAKVIYEAMACGLPVIVTPNAGSVARNGKDGFVVPPAGTEALMEALLHLYHHPEERAEMGRSARSHIEKYTWDVHREQLIAAYERAFERAGKA